MLADLSIPIEVRKDWVWAEIAKVHPEIKRENFSVDDPYMLCEIVARNCYRYNPVKGALVLDVGANVGVFTAFCAVNGATVMAFEPHPRAFRILVDTIERNGIQERTMACQTAIWTYRGRCPYHPTETPPDNSLQTWTSYNGAVVWPEDSGPDNTECITLADALGTSEWDCVKIDVEGAEFEILMAASDEALSHIKYLTLEIHNGWARKDRYDALIFRLSNIFELDGTPEGDPRFFGECRFNSLYGSKR